MNPQKCLILRPNEWQEISRVCRLYSFIKLLGHKGSIRCKVQEFPSGRIIEYSYNDKIDLIYICKLYVISDTAEEIIIQTFFDANYVSFKLGELKHYFHREIEKYSGHYQEIIKIEDLFNRSHEQLSEEQFSCIAKGLLNSENEYIESLPSGLYDEKTISYHSSASLEKLKLLYDSILLFK